MLDSKQRAYLKSLAMTQESIFQIGKQGAAPETVKALDEALEKRELIKINVLNNCAYDIKEIADIISERTHSETVQIIGKKIIFYRASKTKPVIELPKKNKKQNYMEGE